MPIPISADSLDAIPEAHHELYTEKDGKYVLTGVEGMKTQADVDRVQQILAQEKQKRLEATQRAEPVLNFLGDRSLEDIQSLLDSIPELEARANAGGEVTDDIRKAIEDRVRNPLDRKLSKLETDLAAANEAKSALEQQIFTGKLNEELRRVATEANIRPEAMDDWLLLGRSMFEAAPDGEGFVSREGGLTPDLVLADLQSKRSHWWETSVGGGATGSGAGGIANNPFSDAHWNVTKQGEYLKTHGAEKTAAAAKAAGTTVGGPRPTKK